ncbi:MAG: hypothetical protein BMS9Abin08_0528 [Gammaproteobacteria bacterium]|nr:MAG: hypothetical protein BMS9Abin08_0528 [Gammaproteobacteria bacterium]
MTRRRVEVKSRNEPFVQRTVTRIWQEQASVENPYIAESCRCHGYDLLELMTGRSYVDVLYLLFRGELPGKEASALLEALMIGMINPGPRHPATRAAMNAGVGKTDPVHILPVALTVMGGSHLGAGEIEAAMRFLRKHRDSDPGRLASELLQQPMPAAGEDWCLAPGFGWRFGSVERLPGKIAGRLSALTGSGAGLHWGCAFADALAAQRLGWLNTGVTAAVLVDLGFHPRDGAGLFQLLSAPGLLAHGLELANKPVTAMPYVDDEHYVIEKR